jgi:valyl-tRNA synthetase
MQWFISVTKPFILKHSNIPGITSGSETTLKKIMRASVESKAVTVLPERFEKTYFHWIDNLRDWCISRQIWYGHRIPVWYKGSETYVGMKAPTGDGWTQDEDTLDTWFSSGLWTFSTLGWPEETADFNTYHPTALLETGYDILFFWVARMILMSGYLLGDVPFRTVYLHGLVRDEKGRKMSKSLGNIVDPLSLIEKYGADSLRMAMIVAVGPGNDSNLSEEKVKAYKKFGNKMWNMTRFILSNTEDASLEQPTLTDADNSRIKELDVLVQEVTDDMENYRLYLASEKLYHYIWHTFADIILEEAKPALMGEDAHAKQSAQWTLTHILKTSLKLLHPFMPFITEEIWSSLPFTETDMIMVAPWPKSNGS